MEDNRPVTKLEFAIWSRELSNHLIRQTQQSYKREVPQEEPVVTPPPEPEVDESIKDADSHKVPDWVDGLPEIEDDYEEPSCSPAVKPGLSPVQDLDPDRNIAMDHIPISGLGEGYGMKGRERDKEEAERELGDSYGG